MSRDLDEAALQQFLAATMDKPFVWGGHDCITFAARAVVAAGGPNIMACVQRPWNRRRALLFVDMLGGVQGCLDALSRTAGLRPIARGCGYLNRGDIALVENEGRAAAGIVLGADVAVVAETGWTLRPRRRVVTGWAW